MKREKIVPFVLALCLLLPLTACAQEQDQAQEPVRAAVFCDVNAPAETAALFQHLDTALNGSGLLYRKYDAATQTNQNKQIGAAIAEGYGLLIVKLINPDSAVEVLETARGAGAGVIFAGCDVPKAVLEGYEKACCVVLKEESPEAAQGRMIGEYLLAHFDEADLNGDGTVSYLLLGENEEALQRARLTLADGSLAAMKPCEVEAGENHDLLKAALAQCSLENNNMVECIIAPGDEAALAAAETLQAAGYNGSDQIHICVFSVCGTGEGIAAVEAGTLTGTVWADPQGAAETIRDLALTLAGGQIPAQRYAVIGHRVLVRD